MKTNLKLIYRAGGESLLALNTRSAAGLNALVKCPAADLVRVVIQTLVELVVTTAQAKTIASARLRVAHTGKYKEANHQH
ncbi:MAG: hypothetical protein ACLGJB_10870 [Blastocatellia bacterium]